jgi:hypothetical protein
MKYLLSNFAIPFLILSSASAALADGELMLIDNHGKPVWDSSFTELSLSAGGLYFASTKGNPKRRLLDANGTEITCPVPAGFILKDILFPADFETYNRRFPKDTLLRVSKGGLTGLIDLSGKIVVPIEYQSSQVIGTGVLRFNRSSPSTRKMVARVFDVRTKHLSVNEMQTEGAELYPGGDDLWMFSTPPSRDGKYGWSSIRHGFRDRDLNIVIPAIYERCTWFRNGLAVAYTPTSTPRKESRSVFIDKSGKAIAESIIPSGPFNNQGFATASSEANPSRLGLVNRKFEFVVEPLYEQMIQVAPHIYAAKKTGAEQQVAIDDRGNQLFKFPCDMRDVRPFDDGISDPNYIVASMIDPKYDPPEGYKEHDCLFGADGTVLIPPKFYLLQVKYGLVEAMAGTGDQRKSGILDTHGVVQVPFQLSYLDIVGPNKIIKTVRNEEFDSEDWKEERGHPTSRSEQFAKFLKQYDLIGMSLDKSRELLGKGSEIATPQPNLYRCRYYLLSGPCGHSWSGFELEFDHRVLKRWRYSHGGEQDKDIKWLTDNMVYEPAPDMMHAKLVKK